MSFISEFDQRSTKIWKFVNRLYGVAKKDLFKFQPCTSKLMNALAKRDMNIYIKYICIKCSYCSHRSCRISIGEGYFL